MINPERWRQVDDLFQVALERAPEERTAFINAACGDDDSLRREVEALLAADRQAQTLLEAPAYALAAPLLIEADTPALLGKRIGHYEIISLLGKGGMGEVYRARDARLDRDVALKVLPQILSQDAERLRRFKREARAVSALNHPNIITIHEIGEVRTEAGNTPYIITELVEGETLRQRMAAGKLSLNEALNVTVQVAGALQAAHEARIIHRDIKPENVMVRRDGVVKVLDFGLAKIAEPVAIADVQAPEAADLSTSTESGVVMGTVSYMSPEQARGLKVDQRTDIFSLGVMLYEMIVGRKPFEGATASDVIAAILIAEPAPLSRHLPETEPELERIVSRALRKDRDERYQAVQILSFDLKSFQRQIESSANQHRIQCLSCRHENLAGCAFCGKCGRALSAPKIQLLPGALELPERALQTRSLSAQPESERRQATVLCSRLSGYAALVEHLSPTEVEEIIGRIKEAAVEIIESYGGMLERFADKEMVALFGLPSSHEDDYLRAVRAGLAVHARVRELCADAERRIGESVQMATGVSTGALVTQAQSGNSGSGVRKVSGEAIDAAEKLVAFAEADEVLISQETHRLVASFFESETGGPFPIKPKTKPVTVYRILKESGVLTRLEAAAQSGLTRYTGRDNELGALHRALAAARGGEGQLATVIGEAGVGKSRLLLEFQRGLNQQVLTILQGRCQAYQSAIPYLPFIDLLRDTLNLREGDTPAQLLTQAIASIRAIDANLEFYIPVYLHLLSLASEEHPLPDSMQGEELRVAIREALAALFTLKAKNAPAVIFLEDWHWADEGSEEVLKRLAGMLAAYPLLLIVTCRPERAFDWLYSIPHTRLNLAPLDANGSGNIIKFVLNVDDLPAGLSDLLYQRTGGNPFFIEEICRSLVENGRVQIAAGKAVLQGSLDKLDLPDTVQAVIRTRLDRLDTEARRVIRHAAVIGREFNRSILSRVLADTAELSLRLEKLQTLGLIQQTQVLPEPAYRFKHVLTQEVAYDSMLAHQRRSLHEAVGQALEAAYRDRLEEHLELLAQHFSRAENWPKAVQFGREAAEKASRLSRLSEALQWFEQTEGWLVKLPASVERKQMLANVLLQQERQCKRLELRQRQQVLIERLLSLLDAGGDQALLPTVYLRQGELLTLQGHLDEAEAPLQQSLTLCRAQADLRGESETLRGLGFLYWHQGRQAEAIQINESALKINQVLNDTTEAIAGLMNLAQLVRNCGELERALAYLQEADELNQELDNPSHQAAIFYFFSTVYRDRGEVETALRYYQQCYEIQVQHSYLHYNRNFTLKGMANLCWESGKIEECLHYCDDLVSLNRNLQMRNELAPALSIHGLRLMALSRFDEAFPRLLEAAELFAELGDTENEIVALTGLARSYELSGTGDEKCLATWAKIRMLRRQQNDACGEIEALKELARLARRQVSGKDAALGYLQEACDLAAGRADAAAQGDLLNTMGIIEWERAAYDRALDYYEQALQIFRRLDDRKHAGLMLNSIGVTLKRLGRTDEALARLEEAVQRHRESGKRLLEGHALAALGDLCNETKSYGQAAAHYRASLEIRREIKDRKGEGWMLARLAAVATAQAATDEAHDLLHQALTIAEEIGDGQLQTTCARLR